MRTTLWTIVFSLNTLLTLVGIYFYPKIPVFMPGHFNLSGRPDGWVVTAWHHWMMPAMLALFFSIFFFALAFLIYKFGRKNPAILSIPLKHYFLKLPFEKQLFVFDSMSRFLAVQAILVTALFGSLQAAIYFTATEHVSASYLLLPAFFSYAVLVTGTTFLFYMSLKSQIRRVIHEEMGL